MLSNPLSFSKNIHQDLSVMVREALTQIGVSRDQLSNFDSHSTITIELENEKMINLSLVEDRLVIWSFISLNKEKLVANSRQILTMMTAPIRYIELGHCALGACDGGYELKALIDLDGLKKNKLRQVINDFYHTLISIS